MDSSKHITLKPRRAPRQARSQATVDAIFDATIQVLLAEGLQRLTTIRVAERAGASIGTLYQYYPNKQSLLFAVLERHLVRIGDTLEQAATSVHHTPLDLMVPAVVDAFVKAKTAHMEESRALYSVADALDSQQLVQRVRARNRAILSAMLATASDVQFEDLATATFMFSTAMIGPMRAVIEGNAPSKVTRSLRKQIGALCLGYLEREAQPRNPARNGADKIKTAA